MHEVGVHGHTGNLADPTKGDGELARDTQGGGEGGVCGRPPMGANREGAAEVGYGHIESEALVPKARGTMDRTVGGGCVEALAGTSRGHEGEWHTVAGWGWGHMWTSSCKAAGANHWGCRIGERGGVHGHTGNPGAKGEREAVREHTAVWKRG